MLTPATRIPAIRRIRLCHPSVVSSANPSSRAAYLSMASTSTSSPQSQVPRPSASVIIVNSRNEILLVHRNPQARHFGGVHVFPGGNLDKKQDDSLAITAIRETFEESGLLLASSASNKAANLSDVILDEARSNIHSQKLNFQTFLSKHQLAPDTNSLLPFTQWITPVNVLRRFHTQFFVAFLPAAPSAGFSSGAKQDRIPKPDGGQEVVSARFLHPEDALAEFREGKVTFMPPQAYLLQTLSEILKGRENTAAQRERVETLSKGLFGRMVINPRRFGTPDDEGRTVLTYEGDETRGGSKGRLHRVVVRANKGGITSEVKLQRNFDIFTEIEPQAFAVPSKL
ncbi:NUDIX hydrolase domain-like protein [Lyophyllum atratum]|nr:NUDIX hydrolase domain-like protein [Lyophyllum atratum]